MVAEAQTPGICLRWGEVAMGNHVRRLGPCLAVLLGLMALAAPASAAAPTKEVFEDEGLFALPDINCHGFKLTEETLDETVTVLTYTDKAGNVTAVTVKVNFFGVLTNSKTGETFRDHVSFTEHHDLVEGTTTITGSTFHFVESGEGVVFSEGGNKIIVDEDGSVSFDAGPNDFGTSFFEGLCEALA
jgi:hypothetical protein